VLLVGDFFEFKEEDGEEEEGGDRIARLLSSTSSFTLDKITLLYQITFKKISPINDLMIKLKHIYLVVNHLSHP